MILTIFVFLIVLNLVVPPGAGPSFVSVLSGLFVFFVCCGAVKLGMILATIIL